MVTPALTDKQREVKDLMDKDPSLSVPEIAERLGISKPTAYQHVRNIDIRERNGGRAKAKRRAQRGQSAPQHIVPPDDSEQPDDGERLVLEEPGATQNGAVPSLEEHVELELEAVTSGESEERAIAAESTRRADELAERKRRLERVREALHASEAQRSLA